MTQSKSSRARSRLRTARLSAHAAAVPRPGEAVGSLVDIGPDAALAALAARAKTKRPREHEAKRAEVAELARLRAMLEELDAGCAKPARLDDDADKDFDDDEYDADADLPRDEDGRVSAQSRCAPEEIEAFGLGPPPPRRRHDAWTPAKMADFIDALGATGTVSGACATVDISRMSAYLLRNGADAGAFRLEGVCEGH